MWRNPQLWIRFRTMAREIVELSFFCSGETTIVHIKGLTRKSIKVIKEIYFSFYNYLSIKIYELNRKGKVAYVYQNIHIAQ